MFWANFVRLGKGIFSSLKLIFCKAFQNFKDWSYWKKCLLAEKQSIEQYNKY